MIVCGLLRPGSKLRVERELGPACCTTLAALLQLRDASANELYQAMDWLAKRHLADGSLALIDVSSYLEGSRCELARHAYSRDHRSDRPQIVYAVLCSPDGCPVAIEAFPGNTTDPDTLAQRVQLLRERFGLQRVALVSDRGMLAQTRIEADLEPAGFDWITALRSDTIRKLVNKNVIQPSLFDTPNLASVTCADYPGERLLVCFNPLVAAQRRRMGKHFEWTFDEDKAEGPQGPVGPAQRSAAAQRKDGARQTLRGGQTLQSFEDLLEHLGGLTVAESQLEVAPEQRVAVVSALTPLQQRAFKLLGVKPHPAPAAELPTAGAAA